MIIKIQTAQGERSVNVCRYCKTACIPWPQEFCSGHCARNHGERIRQKPEVHYHVGDERIPYHGPWDGRQRTVEACVCGAWHGVHRLDKRRETCVVCGAGLDAESQRVRAVQIQEERAMNDLEFIKGELNDIVRKCQRRADDPALLPEYRAVWSGTVARLEATIAAMVIHSEATEAA